LEFDKWKRLRIQFPDIHDGVDSLNTRRILEAQQAKYNEGWSPLSYQSFLAKTNNKTIAYDWQGNCVKDLSQALGHEAEFEVDILPFVGGARGWFVRVTGIRIKK
jgi:hypothetical protein